MPVLKRIWRNHPNELKINSSLRNTIQFPKLAITSIPNKTEVELNFKRSSTLHFVLKGLTIAESSINRDNRGNLSRRITSRDTHRRYRYDVPASCRKDFTTFVLLRPVGMGINPSTFAISLTIYPPTVTLVCTRCAEFWKFSLDRGRWVRARARSWKQQSWQTNASWIGSGPINIKTPNSAIPRREKKHWPANVGSQHAFTCVLNQSASQRTTRAPVVCSRFTTLRCLRRCTPRKSRGAVWHGPRYHPSTRNIHRSRNSIRVASVPRWILKWQYASECISTTLQFLARARHQTRDSPIEC